MPDFQTIAFPEWTPDQGLFGNPNSAVIKNCLPSSTGYRPLPGRILRSVEDLTSGVGVASGLDARCQGAVSIRDEDPEAGTAITYTYAGDATKLYRVDDTAFDGEAANRDWTDFSKSGGYSLDAGQQWEGLITGIGSNNLGAIFTNINDEVQVQTVGGGSNFADLISSTLKPRAAHMCATTNFLVLGNTVESSVQHRQRVRWSALNDTTDFDASATTQSDADDVDGDGDIQRLVAWGRDFYVFQEYGISVAHYEGTPTIFRFDLVEKNIGVVSPGSVVSFGRFVFFLSHDGFKMFDGSEVHHIGKEKVDQWLFDNIEVEKFGRISSAIDPRRGIIAWNIPASRTGTGFVQLFYSWVTKTWTYADVFNVEHIFSMLSTQVLLDDFDIFYDSIDDIPLSLDNIAWQRGFPVMGSFDAIDHSLHSHDGPPVTATMETPEQEHNPGYLTMVDIVRPLHDGEVDGGSQVVAVGTRNLGDNARTFGSNVAINGIGEADVRSAARRHTYRVEFRDGFDHARGIQVQARQWGRQ